MNIAAELTAAEAKLRAAEIENARLDAAVLLAFITGRDRTFLVAHPEYELTDSEHKAYTAAILRRCTREPLQYITGVQEFYGIEFLVSPDVLIPRPETELLVEEAIKHLKKVEQPAFCEIGSGSGCISVAVLKNVPDARAVAADISPAAAAMTAENARRAGVLGRLEVIVSDVFSAVGERRFDAVLSNPPYIGAGEVSTLQPEVREHEPYIALTDDADGSSIIRRLIGSSPEHLTAGGVILIEIGFSQARAVEAMFAGGRWNDVVFIRDLQGHERIAKACLARV